MSQEYFSHWITLCSVLYFFLFLAEDSFSQFFLLDSIFLAWLIFELTHIYLLSARLWPLFVAMYSRFYLCSDRLLQFVSRLMLHFLFWSERCYYIPFHFKGLIKHGVNSKSDWNKFKVTKLGKMDRTKLFFLWCIIYCKRSQVQKQDEEQRYKCTTYFFLDTKRLETNLDLEFLFFKALLLAHE